MATVANCVAGFTPWFCSIGRSLEMWRVELTSEQSSIIKRLIDHFPEQSPDNLAWQEPFVRENDALPLYIGWSETTGIKADGHVILWCTEPGMTFIEDIDKSLFRASLMDGVNRYSSLSFLRPKRPADAKTCSECLGTGTMPHERLEKMICQCGGVGWMD